MRVIAYPNRHYPPPPVHLDSAAAVVDGMQHLDADLVAGLGCPDDRV
jgi:hypothetical protein